MADTPEMSDRAKSIIDSSLADFKKIRPTGLFKELQGTHLNKLKFKLLEIQSSQEQEKSMRDLSRVSSFIEAFEGFVKTVRLNPEQTACIWGPVLYILNVAKDSDKVLDDVLKLYRGLGIDIQSVIPYGQLMSERPEVSICLANMYQDLLLFHKELLGFFSAPDWKTSFHANWTCYSEESFPTIRDSFKLSGKTLATSLEIYRHQMSRDTASRFNNYLQNSQDNWQDLEAHIRQSQKDRKELLENARSEREARREKRLKDLKKQISAPMSPQDSLHDSFVRLRTEYPGTTDWIIMDDKIKDWIDEESAKTSILYVTGKKGAGKTILASRIIEHCRASRPDFSTSFFYCREDDQNQTVCLRIYQWLLSQMLDHNPDLEPSCTERLRGNRTSVDESTARDLIGLFCSADMNHFIILDGIDEIESKQRKSLLTFFSTIVKKCDDYKPGKVRIMFLSNDPANGKDLEQGQSQTVDLNTESIQADIETYVKARMGKLERKFSVRPGYLRRGQELTIARSAGMFLFASLAMENLSNQITLGHLEEQLQDDVFPRDLNTAYDGIIRRLRQHPGHENRWPMSKKIFGWLACAKRPLGWHEIQAALSMVIDDFDGSVSMDYERRRLQVDIREICGSLVQKLGNSVMFVHSTVKAYIIHSQWFNTALIERDFTTTCLRYLSSTYFRGNLAKEAREDFARQGCYVFQHYALAKWGYHLSAVIQAESIRFNEPIYLGVDLSSFSQAIAKFVEVYGSELSVPADNHAVISEARDKCKPFSHTSPELYENLVRILAHYSHHQTTDIKTRNTLSLPSLASAVDKIASAIESVGPQAEMRELYGPGLFKCNYVECGHFYAGFETSQDKEKHIEKHARPYGCEYPDCFTNAGGVGFATKKEQSKHVRMYHSDDMFPATPRERVEKGKYPCPKCGHQFTRKANLDAHMRAYDDERPFKCRICERAFVRNNDRKRHTKRHME